MRKLLWLFKAIERDEGGQAVVEYILMLTMALGVVATVGIAFKKVLLHLWESFTKDISAACPGCPSDPRYRLR